MFKKLNNIFAGAMQVMKQLLNGGLNSGEQIEIARLQQGKPCWEYAEPAQDSERVCVFFQFFFQGQTAGNTTFFKCTLLFVQLFEWMKYINSINTMATTMEETWTLNNKKQKKQKQRKAYIFHCLKEIFRQH